jgi:predicted Fe-S protein YdhL (DUF1289 family)
MFMNLDKQLVMLLPRRHRGVMSAAAPPRPIRTPCIQVCVLDEDSGLCLGCFRTLEEIADWARLGDPARAALMARLPARRAQIAPDKLGPV